MAQNKAALLLLAVLTLCTVTTSSPLVERYVSASEESSEQDEPDQQAQEMCRNNSGSDAAFLALKESFPNTLKCFADAIDYQTFVDDLRTLTNETRTTFFPRYCPQLRNSYTCTKMLLNNTRPCLKKDVFTLHQALFNALPDAVDLMCKNDGEIFSTIEEPQYVEFIEKFVLGAEECANRFLNESKDWNISDMNQDQCNKQSRFRKCVQDEFNIHKAPLLINVIYLFYNPVFHMTTCGNYVDLENVVMIQSNDIIEAHKIAVADDYGVDDDYYE